MKENMYTKFFLLFISVVLFLVFDIWSILKTKYGEWVTLSAFTKIDIVEEGRSYNDDFVPHDYEGYTKILLAAVVASFVTLIGLWSFNKRISRKRVPSTVDTSNANNNVEVIWECNDEANENDSKFVDSQNDKDNDDVDIKTLLEMHKQLINQDSSLYGSLCDRISAVERSLFTLKEQTEKLAEDYKNLGQIQDSHLTSGISTSGIILKDYLKDVSWHNVDNKVETESEEASCIRSSHELTASVNSTGDSKVVSDSADSSPVLPHDDTDLNSAYENAFNEEEYLRNSKLRFSSASYVQNKTKRAKLPRKPGTICILQDNTPLQDQKSAVEMKAGESCIEYAQTKRPPHSRQNRKRF